MEHAQPNGREAIAERVCDPFADTDEPREAEIVELSDRDPKGGEASHDLRIEQDVDGERASVVVLVILVDAAKRCINPYGERVQTGRRTPCDLKLLRAAAAQRTQRQHVDFLAVHGELNEEGALRILIPDVLDKGGHRDKRSVRRCGRGDVELGDDEIG